MDYPQLSAISQMASPSRYCGRALTATALTATAAGQAATARMAWLYKASSISRQDLLDLAV